MHSVSGRRQTQRTQSVGFHFYEASRGVTFMETESRMVAAGARGMGSQVFNGYRVSVWEDGNILETNGGDGRTAV